MLQNEHEEQTRYARRWADVAWGEGWYTHAIDVLGKAIELHPDNFKLYRKRGASTCFAPIPRFKTRSKRSPTYAKRAN